uniref:ATP synthase subunit a n=1 Tax=Nuttallina californica TaxID=413430 RepID=A0A0E3DE03_9MOLL|nr:ATP synthase F0 subunit 6 [Nuttallina californica]AIA77068.1 ATP synthase F0 subunit 6 [Nuttallina californica]
MMSDIFSNFDPNNFTILSLSSLIWVIALFPLILLQNMTWSMINQKLMISLVLINFMSSQIKRNIGKNISGFIMSMVSIFLLLILVNLMGMVPYVFSLSSHLSFAFIFGLPIWASLIISASTYKLSSVIAHLLPTGAPAVLNPFLVLVETVSISVRPITLSVRLVANMSAGHIILILIASYLSSGIFTFSLIVVLLMILIQIFYFMFEMAICGIQAYIFTLLSGLYSDEHPMWTKLLLLFYMMNYKLGYDKFCSPATSLQCSNMSYLTLN